MQPYITTQKGHHTLNPARWLLAKYVAMWWWTPSLACALEIRSSRQRERERDRDSVLGRRHHFVLSFSPL